MFEWSSADKKVLPLTLILIILITLILWFCLRNKNDNIKKIPLVIITSIMLILEVFKQIISISSGYNLWHVPLHFCSLFIYWFPLMMFAKNEKVKNFGQTMSFACSVSVFLCFYFDPGTILGNNNTKNIFETFFTFHTFVYHHLIFLFLFVGISLKLFKINKNCFLHILIGVTTYVLVALIFAYILNTNYTNLLTSQISFVEAWRQKFGQTLYTIGMYLFGLSLCSCVCGISLLIKKLKKG